MAKHRAVPLRLLLALALLLLGPAQALASRSGAVRLPIENAKSAEQRVADAQSFWVSQEAREAAAARKGLLESIAKLGTGGDAPAANLFAAAAIEPTPGGIPDYFGDANWAFSPPLAKFVDTLPGLGPDKANNLGQFIPVGKPDTITYPGSDYYEIELRQFKEQMHTDLPPTTLRGYVQVNKGTDANGQNTLEPDPIHQLGPFIVARKDRPVRVKFINKLPTGEAGDLFIPVDTTVMGAGDGPLAHEHMHDPNMPMMDMKYKQNRATLHLHGGISPWISDGTPHQWITPAGEDTPYPQGVSVKPVPDMPDPGPGAMTFFYTNQQSARLMFYHDHSYGITRLNVYAGEAAGYMITDPVEDKLVSDGVLPAEQLPLIIQDKSFVDSSTVRTTDPTWNWGTGEKDANGYRAVVHGDLWYPHVYSPAQNPADPSGMNAFGRWHYGPWFWPPTQGIKFPPVANPYYDPVNAPWENDTIPPIPNPSMAGEAFMDTPIVNGTAFPKVELDPKSYRLRILNAASDRFWNLQMYEADTSTVSSDNRRLTEVKMVDAAINPTFPEGWPTDGRDGGVPDPTTAGPDWIQIGTEGGFLPKPAIVKQQPVTWNTDPTTFNFGNVDLHSLLLGPAERADVVVDFSKYAGKTLILYNDAPAAFPARDPRLDYYTGAPDLTDTGGHSGPQVGFGPNTRTIMQIKITTATPEPEFDLAKLNDAFTTTATKDGVFKSGQNPVIIPEARYNEAYNASFPVDPFVRIFHNSKTFKTVAGNTVTIPFQAKAIQDEMGEAFDTDYGRMSGKLGLQLPMPTTRQTFVLQNYIDPSTENVKMEMEPMAPVQGDGTQIWKITHNGVDTHPIHWHLFDVQVINRVGWDNGVRPPDDNELGWKDTVRVNPLEDTIVALRPVQPKVPWGVPDSVRLLDPTMPEGSTMGFSAFDPFTGERLEVPTVNKMVNFGWEYVWHCHILSHEEMDMMRPMSAEASRALAPASSLTGTFTASAVDLTWTDPTPADAASTWGDPANEIGYRVQRAPYSNGATGTYSTIATALANATSYSDTTADQNATYVYRVVAFNAAGDTPSNAIRLSRTLVPAAPTSLTATLVAGQVKLDWFDNATNEDAFFFDRSMNGGPFNSIGGPGPNPGTGPATYTDAQVELGVTYAYRVRATNAAGASDWSNVVTITVPARPATTSTRISSVTRPGIAVLAAREAYPNWTGVKDVVIASYADAARADVLAANSLAGAYDAPLLLVAPTTVPAETLSALRAMPAGVNVHIVGGTATISSAVFTTIDGLANVGTVDRVSGADRYALAVNVATRMRTVLGAAMPSTALIVNGADAATYYDAMSAGPVSVRQHFPILLVSATAVPTVTRTGITNLGLNTLYIIGGPATVNETVRTSLGIPSGNRISGANRYSTAVAVANRAKAQGWLGFATVGMAASLNDALVAGPMLGKKNGVLLLVTTNTLPTETSAFLSANKAVIDKAYVVGYPTVITIAVQTAIDNALK